MKISRALLLAVIFSIPFGVDLFLGDFAGRGALQRFQEFSSFSFYAVEGLLLLACVAAVFEARKEKAVAGEEKIFARGFSLPVLFLLFSLGSMSLAFSPAGLLLFFRLVMCISFLGILAVFLRARIISFSEIAATIAASALFQAVIGIVQFTLQRSVGLWFFGEPAVDFYTSGVGRVFIDGGRLLRSFGTFPHANIFAAFLVLGLAALFYLFLRESEKVFSVKRIAISFGFLLVFCALLFSFSRSGWIGAGVLVVSVLTLAAIAPSLRFRAGVLFLRLVAVSILIFLAFGHLAVPRAAIPLKTDPSFNYRLRYNRIGYETIRTEPWGVGLGNQVAYGVKNGLYEKEGIGKTEPWNWQPVHNLYLLIVSEVGIPAFFAFFAFLILAVGAGLKIFWSERGAHPVSMVCILGILAAFLVLGLSDHYFWDMASGRLMFWLVLGILLGISPHAAPRGTGDYEVI